MSQNIINQKIYLALWFWYIFVLLIGVVQLVFEAVVIAVPAFRNLLITWNLVIGVVEFPREEQRYTYRVLQTIQMKLILVCVLAEPAVLGSTKTALKFKYEI